ncbi:Hypothetical protein A7982_02638 [Minicystis rosea]|nr:Hypothetical protein A7982_02638 [Minicystis rosea]
MAVVVDPPEPVDDETLVPVSLDEHAALESTASATNPHVALFMFVPSKRDRDRRMDVDDRGGDR